MRPARNKDSNPEIRHRRRSIPKLVQLRLDPFEIVLAANYPDELEKTPPLGLSGLRGQGEEDGEDECHACAACDAEDVDVVLGVEVGCKD